MAKPEAAPLTELLRYAIVRAMLTAKNIWRIFTPPYLFQPEQIAKRIWRGFFWRSEATKTVTLPWGLPIIINPREAIGYNISSQGLYEMGVTEALWRLTSEGDLTIDAGANIGYTASVLAVRAGRRGRVICFEPHPIVFDALHRNVENWRSDTKCGTFTLYQAALGPREGTVMIRTTGWFKTNRGTAYILHDGASDDAECIPVEMFSLDSVVGNHEMIGVLKMDVQGSEIAVLQGMTRILENHSVRDIVFEETGNFPAPTHQYLKSKGYAIFGLEESFWRVKSLAEASPHFDPEIGPIRNYLATVDPVRAIRLLDRPMWRSFGFLKRAI